eukprot:jgi/Bigna1/126246/aug1.2_g954
MLRHLSLLLIIASTLVGNSLAARSVNNRTAMGRIVLGDTSSALPPIKDECGKEISQDENEMKEQAKQVQNELLTANAAVDCGEEYPPCEPEPTVELPPDAKKELLASDPAAAVAEMTPCERERYEQAQRDDKIEAAEMAKQSCKKSVA